jgi:hypothetical protein
VYIFQSPTPLNASSYSFNSDAGEEHTELLQRLAKLQQEKWQLEEKVGQSQSQTL